MMDDILASVKLGDGASIHIATLSKQTVEEAGATHLGAHGYFIFEAIDTLNATGINVLGKVASLEAAFRLVDLWSTRP